MKRELLFSITSLYLVSPILGAEPKKPNIILFNMDDMGYGDMSITGAQNYRTPNMDKLAHDGMLFTQFYSAAPISTASRAGLMTGCYPPRVDVTGIYEAESKMGLNPNEEIIPEVLKKSGYKSLMVGKWHLGDAPQFMPPQQGFDEFFGLAYSNDKWPYNLAKLGDNNPKVTKEEPPMVLFEGNKQFENVKTRLQLNMLTTQYTERTVSFIQQNKNIPFFIYVAHSMPHVPLGVSTKFAGKSEQGLYGDVMMELDWSVGEILKAVENAGLTENTLIIITSDNGAWIAFGDNAGSPNGMDGGKFTVSEGGHRAPCFMKWPAVIPAGSVCNKLSSAIDLLPTFANIAHAELPPLKIDGVNILPLMKGEATANPRTIFLYNSFQAIRNTRFKYLPADAAYKSFVGFVPADFGGGGNPVILNKPAELYDMTNDPGERNNVILQYPLSADSLKTSMAAFSAEFKNIKCPGFRASGKLEK
jgi:arylsulfatase